MTYRSHSTAPNRYFDHLYDPLYTASSCRDVWRENYMALRRSAPVQIFPVYKNMFTELTYESRNQYSLLQNPVPFEPSGIEVKTELLNIAGNVVGHDRPKYFANPITNEKTLSVQLADPKPSTSNIEPRTRTTACQTLYRESSAQTLPWLPEAILRQQENKTPELLQMAGMIDGNEYPGEKEIEIIERARCRREWEERLPPITSPDELTKRKPVMEAFEWDQLMQQETEIDRCQRLRYEMVERMMYDRETNNQNSSQAKLENSLRRLRTMHEKKLEKMRLEHARNMRKLERRHKSTVKSVAAVKKEMELVDYIETITVPLPPKRRLSPAGATKFESEYLTQTEYRPVTNIQKYLKPRTPLWKPKEEVKETQKGVWSDKFLGELYESLKSFRQQTQTKSALPQCLVYVSSPTDSEPMTPTGPDTDPNEIESTNAISVQKYIKGRAIQNLIYRGREEVNDLIEELQISNRLQSVRELFPEDNTPQLSLDQPEDNFEHKVGENISSHVGFMLEFLAKEVIRLDTERQAHAAKLFSETDQKERETRSRTSTNTPSNKRRETEEVYRNIFKAEYDVTNTYLENVLIDGISNATEEQAREYVRQLAREISDVGESSTKAYAREKLIKDTIIPQVLSKIPDNFYDLLSDVLNNFLSNEMLRQLANTQDNMEDLEQAASLMNNFIVPQLMKKLTEHNRWTEEQSEEMKQVGDLIQEFVAPEVFRVLNSERQKRERQAHLLAAHNAIWRTVNELDYNFYGFDDQPNEINEAKTEGQSKHDQATLSQVSSIDSSSNIAEAEALRVIDESIYKSVKTVLKIDSQEEKKEIEHLSLQKQLLNRIVANINRKLEKEMENGGPIAVQRPASSRSSVDIYLNANEPTTLEDDAVDTIKE